MTAIAVTIAGSDSSGGAGIQADLKTFSALGVYGASVITALTAQNTVGVQGIHDVPAGFVALQMDSVFSDLTVNAVKIGMLSKVPVIEQVAAGLDRHGMTHVVLDPVMVAASGGKLLDADAVDALAGLLFPRALLVTPNLPEAAVLLDRAIAEDETEMERQGAALIERGAKAVLMKGGHGTGEMAVDLLVTPEGTVRLSAPRIPGANNHGTGCTLSSAIAAGLAKGFPLDQSVEEAKDYVTKAIVAADRLRIGHGHGPTHHFHAFW
ncbi:bifunctional hydroxymethylpyrimidine kinase/phosphomethylpyrimidine kinase [Phreatobacter aquaticus]|uniref:hydroxymethylpyrimidine kinase n=1 Tax=Phreatobacter aquaticus TaxID=2570229 RepID=A0A4D7QNQ1_9HYPH|nr:bifunctional hydroxymethylpyrimidine kinase/phosphomethylpyrimidine kinase [Phreatobacter aquaticus]QCK88121.1 bifunctional hydroxymethylpyrimidine kinase/phosphomethylpyrimidine kinase [Phreatobacter aquaticus]